jgi:hypothetical protein
VASAQFGWGPALGLALLLGCDTAEEESYSQYNADDEQVTITIGGEELPAVSTLLHSTTGQLEIGTGSVDPGGGPVGTVHRVLVEIADEYASDVDRVTVRTSSGDRGDDEFELDNDSAGEGIWALEITSVGEDGESREDTLTFRLWESTGDTAGD